MYSVHPFEVAGRTSGKASWNRSISKYFLEFCALSKKVYFHIYSGLQAWKRFNVKKMPSLKKHNQTPSETLKLNKIRSLSSCISKLVHPILSQGQEVLSWVLKVLTVLSRKGPEAKSTIPWHRCYEREVFKVEKLRFHLRVFGNARKLWSLLPGLCY